MKKFICSILIIIMALTSVFAYAYTDVDSNMEDTLNTLSKYSIINGYEDQSFKPYNNITRAEFAKIIIEASMYDFVEVSENKFQDVQNNHWAKHYISQAVRMGIVNGTSETTFEPEANITYEQAVKMVVAALGYNEEAVEKGGYPKGYLTVAEELGLLKGISFNNTDYSTRIDVAKLVHNSLFCEFYFLYENEGKLERSKAEQTLVELHELNYNADNDIYESENEIHDETEINDVG